VESDVALERMHGILQIVMGWTNSHMHGFRVPKVGQHGARRGFVAVEGRDEKKHRLGDILRHPKDRAVYEYDFSDGWEHEIVLEDVVPRPSKVLG
jgi:hypothetical protein